MSASQGGGFRPFFHDVQLGESVTRILEAFLASRAAIAAALVVAMIWGFWSPPLYDLDEGAFSEATREMMVSGNYASIFLNAEPRHDKPILIYWLQAASAHLFGLNEFALRLPSVLAGLTWVWALFAFTRRHLDGVTAGVAAMLLALSLFVGLIAKAAVADALLNLFLALALFDIYNHFRHPSRYLLLRIFVWLGLGFLTKGPVAVVFPVLVSGLLYLGDGRWREWLRLVFDPMGLLLFVAIVLPWHIAVYLDSGWAFFEGFYLHHNLARYGNAMEGHSGGVFYYALVAPLLLMPFSGWFLNTLGNWRAALGDPLDRFAWLWFFSVLLVFSFSGTKLPHYMLYGITGVVLLMARYRDRLHNAWLGFVPPLILLGALSVLPQLFEYLARNTARDYDRGLFEAGAQAFSGWPQLLCVFVLALAVLFVFLPLSLWRRLLLIGFAQAALVAGVIVPTVLDVLQAGPKAAGLFAGEQGKDVVFYRVYQPSVSVYRQQVITHEPAVPGQWVYVRSDHVAEFLAQPSPYHKHIVFSQPPATLIAIDAKPAD